MKGRVMSHIAISLIFAAIIASNVHQLDALTVEETCLIVQNGTFIADPSSCQGWAYCLNGAPIYGKCGNGYMYDSTSGVCNYASNVACNTNVTTMCTGLTDVYKADPYNCQNYCYCKDSVTYTESCPSGQYYDPSTISCIWAANSNCVPSSPCLLAQNGFVKNTTSCTGWCRCASGQVVDSGECPSGYYYNPSTAKCDYPSNVACSTSPVAPGTPTPWPNICSSTTYTTKFFIADNATCRGYFYCATTSVAVPPWGQCPKGSQFNQVKQQCNDPNLNTCMFDRCDGVTNAFMTVANTTCNDYYICKNGVENAIGTCPTTYPFFNEVAGVCQQVNPNYGVCAAVTA